MKRLFLAAALATTFLTPVAAAEYQADSHIDAVTVFPRGAEVTREADVRLETGSHMLIFDNLPGEIGAQSIRVEGASSGRVEIVSVDSRTRHVTDDAATASERKQIEDRIEALKDEAAALDQLIADAQYQRKLLKELAAKPFAIQAGSDTSVRLDSSEMGDMFDLVAGKLAALSKTVLEAEVAKRGMTRKIEDLTRKLSELAPKKWTATRVTVHLTSDSAADGTFRLRYRIANAGWQPFYVARLDTGAGTDGQALQLVRRADVVQRTSEAWDDIKLTLSTARPTGATAAPELHSELISLIEEEKRKGRAERPMEQKMDGLLSMVRPSADEADRYAVSQAEAETTIAGFQAQYDIQGRVDIDNSGTAKKVLISTGAFSAELGVQVVPKLDPNAYLVASFTLDGESPLLRGRVLLFRDGVYMGNGVMPMLAPGEEHRLGFGIDDRIKVKRIEVKRRTSETGLISTAQVEDRSWTITVENLHERTMAVTVYDQMPYSTHEDIVVKMLPGSTKPSDRNVERKRGVVSWSYDLDAAEETVINFGYRITRPDGTQVRIGTS